MSQTRIICDHCGFVQIHCECSKYKMMTEQLRLTNSDEMVGNYIRWIITSTTAKEYWQKQSNKETK